MPGNATSGCEDVQAAGRGMHVARCLRSGHNQPVARSQFRKADALLPALLGRLSKDSGRATHLRPVWAQVVGAVTALHSDPVVLNGSVLTVQVESPRWHAAVLEQEAALLERFAEHLGPGVITALRYQVVEPK